MEEFVPIIETESTTTPPTLAELDACNGRQYVIASGEEPRI
jgi:hypothetical protein